MDTVVSGIATAQSLDRFYQIERGVLPTRMRRPNR